MSNQKTAVEWFNEEINKLNVGTDAKVFIAKLLEKAKEMEKQQIIEAYDCGKEQPSSSQLCPIDYYNENFGSHNSTNNSD
jgi:hypothetical protein